MYVITTALMWSVGGSEASHYCHFKATFTRYLSLFTLFSKSVSRSMFPRLILPSPLSLSLCLFLFIKFGKWHSVSCRVHMECCGVIVERQTFQSCIKKYERWRIVLPRCCLPALIVFAFQKRRDHVTRCPTDLYIRP